MNHSLHIILIEDDASQRSSYTKALTKGGYRVDAFAEGETAIEHLRHNPDVALVITDLMMPRMDGFAVLDAARSIDPEVGVLMITGKDEARPAVDAMKKGADDYMTKPVDIFELRKRIDTIAHKRLLSRRVVDLERRLGEKFG